MTPLKDLFSIQQALQLDDASFATITAEPNEVVVSRNRAAEDLLVLREVLEVCNRHIFYTGRVTSGGIDTHAHPTNIPRRQPCGNPP